MKLKLSKAGYFFTHENRGIEGFSLNSKVYFVNDNCKGYYNWSRMYLKRYFI